MGPCRLLTRVQIKTKNNDLLVDRHLRSEGTVSCRNLGNMASDVLQQLAVTGGYVGSVYQDEWRHFLTQLQDCQVQLKPMQHEAIIDIGSDLQSRQKFYGVSGKCMIWVGHLGLTFADSNVKLDIPVISVKFRNQQQREIFLHCSCVEHKGHNDADYTHCIQSVLFKPDKQVVNIHKALHAHVPVKSKMKISKHCSHFDSRQKALTHHLSLMRDLGLSQSKACEIQITEHAMWCKSLLPEDKVGSGCHYMTVYLRL